MAWTTLHFGVGMACGGAAATVACCLLRRGWRWVTPVMTAAGVWALAPDLPRIFREDFPSLPLASVLGDKRLDDRLLAIGDVFFFHRALDSQPKEYALHGLVLILLCYHVGWAMAWLDRRRDPLASVTRRSKTPIRSCIGRRYSSAPSPCQGEGWGEGGAARGSNQTSIKR